MNAREKSLKFWNGSTFLTRAASLLLAVTLAVGLCIAFPGRAAMAEEPPSPPLPETVSSDVLPTPQINGVVWNLVVNGDIAFAVGSFTRARPSGVAVGGAGEIVRNNAMSFNIKTGAILPWNPNLNAQARDIEISPDRSQLFVGGDFTTVGGAARSKVAAFSVSTGALNTSFSTSVGGQVNTVAVTGDAVYIGGSFNSVAGQSRKNVAKLSRSNAALQQWAPAVDDIVHGLIAVDGSERVLIGGRFQTLNGVPKVGIGAVHKDTGSSLPWASTPVPARSGSERSWVVDLKLTNGVVYAANNGEGWHWFDGKWAAEFATGNLVWLDNCYGSTSAISVMGDVLYSHAHAHDCSSLGEFPEANPTVWKRALAETTRAGGTDPAPPSNNSTYANQPTPTLLHWYPSLNTGFYTGQYQGGWAMDNNGEYLVSGGEFTRVNEKDQQGLAVYAKRSIAPNKILPVYTAGLKPAAISLSAGNARVAWPTTWDYDDKTLTYELLRDNSLTSINSQDADATWWKQQSLGFLDTGVAPGSTHTYRVRVKDPWGNTYIGPRSDPVSISNLPANPYGELIKQAGASQYYPLDESSGTVVYDHAGFNDADASAALQRGQAGALVDNPSSKFNGQSIATRSVGQAPDTFTTQLWFRTTSGQGGKLIGFGNSATGDSNSYDRHVWMDNSGRLHFGTWLGFAATVDSSASYNDGQWHQMTATLGSSGMSLYVDGVRIAQRADVTSGQAYSGLWRVGGDNLGGWPNQPASTYFEGDIDEVAVYPQVLSSGTVLAQYQATGRTADIPAPPADAYGKSVYDDEPMAYWRLDETAGITAKDATPAKNDAAIMGSVQLGQASALSSGKSMGFGSNNAAVIGKTAVQNPLVFSTEAWFKTGSTQGGKIIGFGNASSGLSSSYDRHVYMQDNGKLTFGVYTGQLNVVDSPASYNDNEWHHVVATLSGNGMRLYVDGSLVGTNPQTAAEPYTGYWRVGGDVTWGSSSPWFDGQIDEAAVYARELTIEEINDHYSLVGAPNKAPTAAFTSTTNSLDAVFDATGSEDEDGSIVSYTWDFGDGGTGTGSNIQHSYTASGSYLVRLTVRDDRGGSAQVEHTVNVQKQNVPPVAAIASQQQGLNVDFDGTGSSDPDGTVNGYAWEFGDGGTSDQARPSHRYATAGSYTVKLLVTDDSGATNSTQSVVVLTNAAPQAAFSYQTTNLLVEVDGSDAQDPDGTIAEWAWDFGDGQRATGQHANHSYASGGTYDITLTVKDNNGKSASYTQNVSVEAANIAPTAAFDTVADGLQVSLDGSESTDPDGSISSWQWVFGDGGTGTGKNVVHEYAEAGEYTVKLTVTDNKGATDTLSTEITVDNPPATGPVAAFTHAATGSKVTVDGSASTAPAGSSIDSYTWDFGDGSGTSSGVNQTHSYEAPGSYTVKLTVVAAGKSNSVSQILTVTATTPPVAAFRITTTGTTIEVDASDSTPGDAPLSSYAWDFGDGGTATGKTTQHTYTADGNYTVMLTVRDADGGESTATQATNVVNNAPVAAFTLSSAGLDITVDGTDSSDADGTIDSYHWSFGDGTPTASGKTASHQYASDGTYIVKLTVTDNQGKTGSLQQTVNVTSVPEPRELASDSFSRSASSGWGSAEQGGNWLRAGSAANFAVANGAGTIKMSTPGSGPLMYLDKTLPRDADLSVIASSDKAATGGGVYYSLIARDIPVVGDYRVKVRAMSNGSVAMGITKTVNGVTSNIAAETVISNVRPGEADKLRIRVQTFGSNNTTIRAKLWIDGQTEPTNWQLSGSDATAALQQPGRPGLSVYLSGSATNAPVVGSFDDFMVKELLQ